MSGGTDGVPLVTGWGDHGGLVALAPLPQVRRPGPSPAATATPQALHPSAPARPPPWGLCSDSEDPQSVTSGLPQLELCPCHGCGTVTPREPCQSCSHLLPAPLPSPVVPKLGPGRMGWGLTLSPALHPACPLISASELVELAHPLSFRSNSDHTHAHTHTFSFSLSVSVSVSLSPQAGPGVLPGWLSSPRLVSRLPSVCHLLLGTRDPPSVSSLSCSARPKGSQFSSKTLCGGRSQIPLM